MKLVNGCNGCRRPPIEVDFLLNRLIQRIIRVLIDRRWGWSRDRRTYDLLLWEVRLLLLLLLMVAAEKWRHLRRDDGTQPGIEVHRKTRLETASELCNFDLRHRLGAVDLARIFEIQNSTQSALLAFFTVYDAGSNLDRCWLFLMYC